MSSMIALCKHSQLETNQPCYNLIWVDSRSHAPSQHKMAEIGAFLQGGREVLQCLLVRAAAEMLLPKNLALAKDRP